MGLASNSETSTDDERTTVLPFDLESNRYCVDSASVISVLGVTDATTLAAADDPWNAGSVTVTDERVRIVDLPRVFGSSFRTSARVSDPKLLVLDITDDDDGTYFGWLVDDVDGPRSVRTALLEPPHMDTSHVRGRIEIEGSTAVWLDADAMHS